MASLLAAAIPSSPARAALVPLEGTQGVTSLVWSIEEDQLGRLWIGAAGGLYVFDGLATTRVPLPVEADGHPLALRFGPPTRGAPQTLWVLTYAAELWRLDGDRWTHVVTLAPRQLGTWLERAGRDTLVTSSSEGLVVVRDGVQRVARRGEVASLWRLADDRVAAACTDGVFEVLADGAVRPLAPPLPPDAAHVRFGGGDPAARAWLLGDEALSITGGRLTGRAPPAPGVSRPLVVDDDGAGFAAGFSGLFALEPGRAPRPLLDGIVQGLQRTRDGTILAGKQGLFRYVPEAALEPIAALRGHHVLRVERSTDGALWVGSGVGLFSSQGEVLARVPCLGEETIFAYSPTPARVFAADTRSLRVFDRATQRCAEARRADGVALTQVMSVLARGDGEVWVGEASGVGLYAWDAAKNELAPRARWALARPIDLIPLPDAVLVISDAGLHALAPDQPAPRAVWSSTTASRPLELVVRRSGEWCWVDGIQPEVRCARPRADGTLPAEGERRWRVDGDPPAYALVEDADEALWVGTLEGLFEAWGDRHVGAAHGLPGLDVNRNALLAEPDGRLWVGTVGGLSRVAPRAPIFRASVPPVALAGLRSGERALSIDPVPARIDPDAPLVVELGAACRRAACALEARLEPSESTWRRLDRARVELGRPPPGHNTLRVRARHAYGAWSPELVVRLDVGAPWWARTSTAFGAFTLVALLVFVSLHLRARLLEARAQRFEAALVERTAELARAQQTVVELERRAAEHRMALGFAHELRNALSGARLVLERLRGGSGRASSSAAHAAAPGDERSMRVLDTALTRALKLTQELLDYARLGESAPEAGHVALAPIVRDVVRDLELEARGAVTLELDDDARAPGSADQARTVVENLLRNAAEAHPPAARTWIRAAVVADARGVVLTIEDAGLGLTPEALARATEPFFSTKRGASVGLGLAFVRRVVELYGGRLTLAARSEGGARVEVCWPRPESS